MSRYGVNFYGPGTYYGETPLIQFDARPVTAVSIDYGAVKLHWSSPSGSYDRLRVTRDTKGFTPRADMGVLVFEDLKDATHQPRTDYLDSGLIPGKFYYYTVWVRATVDGQYRRAGDVIGLPVYDWNFDGSMFSLVPMFYRDLDRNTPDPYMTGKGQLERFLGIPGFQADHIRTEYETLKDVNDPDNVSGGLLPLMARQLGFGYESELGMSLARQQMRNAVHIYKRKGSLAGIDAFASVMTGWAPTVSLGYNIMLDQNNSSFAESIGRWTNVSNATIGRRSTTDASAPYGAIAGPVLPPTGASTGDVGSGTWMGLLTAIGAGDIVVQSFPAGTVYDNRTMGIPVTGGLPYAISAYTRALDTARSVRLGVEWFDINGTSLGAVTENTAASNVTGGWAGANSRAIYLVTAPANAAFLRVQLRIMAAVTGEKHLFSAIQVEQNATARAYQSARSIRIQFAADRVNIVPNPSAETGIVGWAATNATLAQDATLHYTGAYSFQLTATAGGDITLSTPAGTAGMPVVANRYYTFSSYLFKAAAPARQFRIGLTWYTAAGAVIGTIVQGALVTQVPGTWTRAFVTALAPATAAFVAVTATVLAAGAGEIQNFDSFLGERGTLLLDFFDGTTTSNEGEYLWQSGGTPGATPSHYYARRLIKNFRLNQRMAEFVPAGATYALLYAGAT